MTLELQDAQSYYQASAVDWQDQPPLVDNIEAEVCVIGGGMTGNAAALKLAEAGVSTVLLEAKSLSWGASGRSGGQIIIGQNKSYQWLRKHYGKSTAQKLFDTSRDGIERLHTLCDQYDISCDIKRGHYHVGLKARHDTELKEMLADYQLAGFEEARYFEGAEARERVCSDKITSAIYDPISGHLHPLNYTLGLAKAALRNGVTMYEHSPAIHIAEDDSGFTVTTPKGSVRAKKLMLATNAYIQGLYGEISNYIMPVGTYIIATEPLGDHLQTLIPDGSAVADINFVLNYYRPSADGRMLFGGGVSYTTRTPLGIRQNMKNTMLHFFPSLADYRIDYIWGGYVAITQNRLPQLGRRGKNRNLYFSHGYSGHGVILATACGELCAEAMCGDDEGLRQFESLKHRRFPGGKYVRIPALMLATTALRLLDRL